MTRILDFGQQRGIEKNWRKFKDLHRDLMTFQGKNEIQGLSLKCKEFSRLGEPWSFHFCKVNSHYWEVHVKIHERQSLVLFLSFCLIVYMTSERKLEKAQIQCICLLVIIVFSGSQKWLSSFKKILNLYQQCHLLSFWVEAGTWMCEC